MSDSYLIEIDERPAGILVREGGSYAFHAVSGRYRSLDGRTYPGPGAAERAARKLAPGRRPQAVAPFGPRREAPVQDALFG